MLHGVDPDRQPGQISLRDLSFGRTDTANSGDTANLDSQLQSLERRRGTIGNIRDRQGTGVHVVDFRRNPEQQIGSVDADGNLHPIQGARISEAEPTPRAAYIIEAPQDAEEVDLGGGGRVHGDPHFVGFNGVNYDVHGEKGHTYNLITDSGFQVNALFNEVGDGRPATMMTQIGVVMENDEILINPSGGPTVNGVAMREGQTLNANGGTITYSGGNVTVRSAEYTVTFAQRSGYLDLTDVSARNIDGVLPEGLVGVTANPNHAGRRPVPGGQQGEGVISGTYRDHEVSSIFATDSRYSQFDA